jgi:hypothetical protein
MWIRRQKRSGSRSAGSWATTPSVRDGWAGRSRPDGHPDMVGTQHLHVAGRRDHRLVRPSSDRSPRPSPSSSGFSSTLGRCACGRHPDLPSSRRPHAPALASTDPIVRGSHRPSRLTPPAQANRRPRCEAPRGAAWRSCRVRRPSDMRSSCRPRRPTTPWEPSSGTRARLSCRGLPPLLVSG